VDLGRIGVWSGALAKVPASQCRAAVATIEELGFGTLWYPESVGSKESFSQAGLLLAASEELVIASGIASIWARDPMAMVTGASALAEAYPGRFVLGIGTSTDVSVPLRGHRYERPFSTLRAYVAAMDGVDYTCPKPDPPLRRLIGSLGPKSLAFAASESWGAHTYFVPPAHTAFARQVMGPDAFLAVEQAVLIESDSTTARSIARDHMGYYLQRAAYETMLRRLGWSREHIDHGGSDELVDAIVAWGDVDRVAAAVQAHFDAGADHVCLQPLGSAADDIGLDQLAQLALLGTGAE
jgi:probable F420-dependent oxidoreductase